MCAGMTGLRAMRTPQSVLLQAAGEFRKLTGPGLWSSAVSLIATFVLLMLVGPIAAPLGILLGEAVGTERTFALARAWRHRGE
jgi:putative peptidoglycan lipid II flippase